MAPARNLMVRVDSGDALDVRSFSVEERMSALFEITVVALSADADVDFDAIVGRPARLDVHTGAGARVPVRSWTGVCRDIQLVAAEETGLSTYHLHLVPTLWLATQRRNHRMFQQMSELEIARALLAEWGITPDLRITGRYKKREYRVQYAESDFAFLSRMLEDAGISFFFEQGEAETRLVLSDAPHLDAPRPPIAFRDRPTAADREHVTRVSLAQRIRPGRYTIKDHDPRLPPSYDLRAGAAVAAGSVEGRLERFHYVPGAFQFGADQGESAPFGDDRGKTRTDEKEAGSLAQKRLDAKRARAKVCSFETNAADLAPGVVLSVLDHPRADLAADKRLLVIQSSLRGTAAGDWHHRCEALSAEIAYRPSLATPKPRALGVESATVVGPAGDEIHTDELGRVRVHFHWDRESRMNEQSSCWIHVSQPWAGRGFGVISLPRVGQEVLVDFLGGDPDRPVITGRVYTSPQRVPYALPANKTQSGWKSESSPGGGGFNEIRFEDAKGREQVYLQAEKDLDELVKHDETVTIGNDRRELVKHDEALTVDHDRRRKVGNDESIAVDHDRVKVVGHDESVTVGHDRTRVVAHDESISIGNDRTKQVKRNERETVGKSRTRVVGVNESVKIGKSQRVKVGGQKSEKVGKSSTETVGLAKTVTVGGMHTTTVGGAMTTTVGLMSTETVGLVKHVKAGDKIEITCGKSKIVMERSGKITLSGTEIVIKGKDAVKVDGKEIAVKADDNASVQGGKVQVVGDPIDLN